MSLDSVVAPHRRGSRLAWLMLLLAALGATLAACQPLSLPTAEADTDSRVAVARQGDRLIIDVYSDTGIGNAQVRLNGADPSAVRLRLHLAGLEQLQLHHAGTQISASYASTTPHVLRQSMAMGEANAQPISDASPYWLAIVPYTAEGVASATAPLHDGYFEIQLPTAATEEAWSTFDLTWIDFYR